MASHEKSERVRQQIITATDNLLYHKGYNLMSFSDIAAASGIPRGNLNYHFRTKQEVLTAVIEYRLQHMQEMLDDWQQTIHTPLERLKRYAKVPLNEIDNANRYGCPMGSLNTELGKQQPRLQDISRKQFDLFRNWLQQQFHALLPDQDSDNLAMHLLVRTQGLAIMAQSYADQSLLKREVEGIKIWLDSLVNDTHADVNSK